MKLPFNIEIRRARPTNLSFPPQEQKYGKFTVVESAPAIATADVTNYKTAFNSAHGRYTQERAAFYDLYQNALDFDAHLNGLIDRRILATAGRKIEYMINGEVNERVQEMIDSPVFEQMIRDFIMSYVFLGMGLFDFQKDKEANRTWLKYKLIPIKHVDPYAKKVRVRQYSVSDGDTSYDNVKTALFVGDAENFGLLQQLALIALYKRAALNDWASYSQLASNNFQQIKYKGAVPDPARRDALRSLINSRGKGTIDYSQLEMDITTENQTSSSQNQLFENYVAYLDEQMTKLVLGQTMTTEDGASRSQAEVHERTQESIFDADAKSFLNFMNYQFYDIQQMYGIPSGGRWQYAEGATSKQEQELERDLKLKQLGYMFTQEELAGKYGMKKQPTPQP